jgi:hypothetical protein
MASTSSSSVEVVVVNEREKRLREVWADELRILKRCFRFLMRDMFFRIATFNLMYYSKEDVMAFTKQGFYNVLVRLGNYRNYNIVCIFCDFVFSNERFPGCTLTVSNATYHHNTNSPACTMIRLKSGLNYVKNVDRLGLTKVGMKYLIKNTEKMRPVSRLYLDTMPRPAPAGNDRLQCDICLTNMKNVLTSCNHVSICSVCLMSDQNKTPTECIICRKGFEFYCAISLQGPSFGFTRDLSNIFDTEQVSSVAADGREITFQEDDREHVRLIIRVIMQAGLNVSNVAVGNRS